MESSISISKKFVPEGMQLSLPQHCTLAPPNRDGPYLGMWKSLTTEDSSFHIQRSCFHAVQVDSTLFSLVMLN